MFTMYDRIRWFEREISISGKVSSRKDRFFIKGRLDNCNFLINLLRKKLIEQFPVPSAIKNIMRDRKLHMDNGKTIGGDILQRAIISNPNIFSKSNTMTILNTPSYVSRNILLNTNNNPPSKSRNKWIIIYCRKSKIIARVFSTTMTQNLYGQIIKCQINFII